MKKQYLLMAAFASALAFTACTNDDAPFTAPGEGEGSITEKVVEGATFEINLSGHANGTTKATRPMGSSAADNNVNTIQLKIYAYNTTSSSWDAVTLDDNGQDIASGQLALKYVSGDATNAANSILADGIIKYAEANPDGEGVPGTDQHINKRAKIEVLGLEAGKKYQFVAYGYNGGANSATTYPYGTTTSGQPKLEKAANGTRISENGTFLAEVGTVSNPYSDIEEIFAASDVAETFSDTEDGNNVKFTMTPSLTLTRQIAGMLAYFKDVPMYLGKYDEANETQYRVEKMDIVASHTATDFYFPAMLITTPEFNGVMATNDKEEVVMTFNFDEIATNYPDEATKEIENDADQDNGDVFYTFNTISKNAISATTGTKNSDAKPFAQNYSGVTDRLTLEANTIFGARYLLPYDKHYGEATLKIRFYAEVSGKEVLLEERDVTTNQIPADGTQTAYDIRCNNFYSIGQKLDTENNDPNNPDIPISLKGKNISLRINDAWDILHNMGIE